MNQHTSKKRIQNKLIISLVVLTLFVIGVYFFTRNNSQILGANRVIKPGNYQVQAEDIAIINSRYRMTFKADTQGQAVNAVGLYLSFNPEIMKIINMDTTKSFCQFYPENKFDNDKGTVSIACGAPNPGFTGESEIVTIDFYINNIGKTQIKVLPKSQLLLNDGKGTNIFKEAITHDLTILNNI